MGRDASKTHAVTVPFEMFLRAGHDGAHLLLEAQEAEAEEWEMKPSFAARSKLDSSPAGCLSGLSPHYSHAFYPPVKATLYAQMLVHRGVECDSVTERKEGCLGILHLPSSLEGGPRGPSPATDKTKQNS